VRGYRFIFSFLLAASLLQGMDSGRMVEDDLDCFAFNPMETMPLNAWEDIAEEAMPDSLNLNMSEEVNQGGRADENYVCHFCNKKLASQVGLKRHLQRESTGKCCMRKRQRQEFLETCKAGVEDCYHCVGCGEYSGTKRGLAQHLAQTKCLKEILTQSESERAAKLKKAANFQKYQIGVVNPREHARRERTAAKRSDLESIRQACSTNIEGHYHCINCKRNCSSWTLLLHHLNRGDCKEKILESLSAAQSFQEVEATQLYNESLEDPRATNDPTEWGNPNFWSYFESKKRGFTGVINSPVKKSKRQRSHMFQMETTILPPVEINEVPHEAEQWYNSIVTQGGHWLPCGCWQVNLKTSEDLNYRFMYPDLSKLEAYKRFFRLLKENNILVGGHSHCFDQGISVACSGTALDETKVTEYGNIVRDYIFWLSNKKLNCEFNNL
jgi:hypothetical protein